MPAKTCGAETARTRLPELIERAHRGQPTVITRHGKPYAAVVPVDRIQGPRRGPSLLALAGSGAGLWPEHAVQALRDEWA
jgi:prevent-host-death family protein